MEPNLLVTFVVGALLVLNGVFGNARIPQADEQESATAADDTTDAEGDAADEAGTPGAHAGPSGKTA